MALPESSSAGLATKPMPATASAPAVAAKAVRMFGRFQLLKLLGKSNRTMAWLTVDSRTQQEHVLVMPRAAPVAQALTAWHANVRRASRLNHPHLAPAAEIGEQERWPFVAYARGDGSTWAERFSRQGIPAPDMARWAVQAAQGLAYAHEAGVAHGDLQPWMISVNEAGQVTVMGLETAGHAASAGAPPAGTSPDLGAMDDLRAARDAAVIDVLALGLLLHHGLAGAPALDQADVGAVIARMPPLGSEIIRLPYAVPRPVPEALRAIVNRATDRQERQRYRNARTLQRALEGWVKTSSEQDGGPLALLLDRLRNVGVLPAQPGGAERVAHLALMERGRTSELAEAVLEDIALTFELLRLVNSAQVRGAAVSSDGPVLMLRRAIAMLGLDGVRRAALSLRPWPGPMNEEAELDMHALIGRAQRAGRLAIRLAPAGYDGEVIYLITLMQNLGRLVVQYHFPEEATQIRRLTQAADNGAGGTPGDPGMTAEAASFAVLGADVEALGLAVARHWGLDEVVQQMIRRFPPGAPVHHPESDNEILRTTASCANDLIDATQLQPKLVQAALGVVTRRYARALGLTPKDLLDALQGVGHRPEGQPGSEHAIDAGPAPAARRGLADTAGHASADPSPSATGPKTRPAERGEANGAPASRVLGGAQ
jgi:eukaryotic-like serine/threonine-protein kinase